MNYFNFLPVIKIGNVLITNITKIFNLYENIDSRKLKNYKIIGVKSLEEISLENYNTTKYWWIIALINKINDVIFDLPISEEMIRQIAIDNSYIDDILDENLLLENMEKLLEFNDSKRNIQILDNEKIIDFLRDISNLSKTLDSENKNNIINDGNIATLESYNEFILNPKKYIGFDNKNILIG